MMIYSREMNARWRSVKVPPGRLLLESKDHIRERVGFSPDLGDAAALTVAVDFNAAEDVSEECWRPTRRPGGTDAWMGL
jgi:hypothetical protein